jgi:hypothetical protein
MSVGHEPIRDGNWMDNFGACKVCGGEIPYGHTENCDIYKMDQEINKLKLIPHGLFKLVKGQFSTQKEVDDMLNAYHKLFN